MKNTITTVSLFLFVCSYSYGQASIPKAKSDDLTKTATIKSTSEDSLIVSKSSQMLDEDTYWAIIENSLKETTNQEDQELFLIAELEKMTPMEMIGFRLRTDKLLFDTYNQELWCAAYIINNGCSDGGFDYFRCWLVSRGKDAFYAAKTNPDSILNEINKDQEAFEFEGFWYVAMNAFKNTTDKELFTYIDYDTFTTNDENYPILQFDWNVDEPQTMQEICPILFKNFWK
jgi:hypothetical protein